MGYLSLISYLMRSAACFATSKEEPSIANNFYQIYSTNTINSSKSVSFHLSSCLPRLCRVQLQWPKAIMEARRMQDNNAGALRDWLARTAPAVLRALNLRTAVQVLRLLHLHISWTF